MYRVRDFLASSSRLLIFGALAALVRAAVEAHSYHLRVEYPHRFNDWVGTGLSRREGMPGKDAARCGHAETAPDHPAIFYPPRDLAPA